MTVVLESLPLPLDLALRWGPGLDDDSPSIDVPRDWRWSVACWDHARWVAWRKRSGELQPADPTLEQIRTADHLAYIELAQTRPEPKGDDP